MKPQALALLTALLALALILVGCSSATDLLIAYTGGGLPPGETDIGGVVLAAVPTVAATASAPADVLPPLAAPAQATTVPVPGATVTLFTGGRQVGQTLTGPEGYFRFECPRGGAYEVEVDPPAGSDLRPVRHQFRHRYAQRTFLEITLPPT